MHCGFEESTVVWRLANHPTHFSTSLTCPRYLSRLHTIWPHTFSFFCSHKVTPFTGRVFRVSYLWPVESHHNTMLYSRRRQIHDDKERRPAQPRIVYVSRGSVNPDNGPSPPPFSFPSSSTFLSSSSSASRHKPTINIPFIKLLVAVFYVMHFA